MKKIISILISLLFVASVFGVASAREDICELPSFTTIYVGDTFTLVNSYEPCGEEDDWMNYLEETNPEGNVHHFKAIRPGKVTFNCGSCDEGTVTVTILKKSLPIDKFMKLFGFGKKD